jgi:hypothetical protein
MAFVMHRRSSSYHFAGIVSMRETRAPQNSQGMPLYLPPTRVHWLIGLSPISGGSR